MKNQLSETTPMRLPGGAGLIDALRRAGWEQAEHPSLGTGRAHFQTFQGGHETEATAWENVAGERLLLVALEEVSLPTDDELFPRFLDLGLEERMVLGLAHTLGGLDWLLLRSAGRLDLYRLSDEVCEYRITTLQEYETDLMPALTGLAKGRHRGRGTGVSQLPGAESLAGWLRHWSLQLASVLEVTSDHMERVLWKWIVMLQLRRRVDGCEAPAGGWGLHCELSEGRWLISYDAITATDDLAMQLEHFERLVRSRLLEPESPALRRRLAALDETPLIDRLRAELLMHSQNRFEPETVAWMFTDLSREQEGWRREVRGVEPVRKRMQMNGWTVYAPLVCDVEMYGLTAALGDMERLADFLAEMNLYEQHLEIERQQSASHQPDLFRPHPRGIDEEGRLEDGLNFMLGEALRLRGVEDNDRFGVGVTVLLKALALAARLGWPMQRTDTLDEVFREVR